MILTTFLTDYPRLVQETALPPAQKGVRYSSRQVSRLLGLSDCDWPEKGRASLRYLVEKNDTIGQVRDYCLHFKVLMKDKKPDELAQWCRDASASVELIYFVKGLRQDYAAVEQAIGSIWSNGQKEGQVNRLKTLKRQLYGKASFDLLRIQVLARNRTGPQSNAEPVYSEIHTKELKTLHGLTPHEFVCGEWQKKPATFTRDPTHHTLRLYI